MLFVKNSKYFEFYGYKIPVDLLNKTGGGVDTFTMISEGHIKNLKAYAGLNGNMDLLEIGCGIGRDAIPLTNILGKNKNYFGIDIIPDSIKWCQDNITRRSSNFKFAHIDIKDKLHNSDGKLDLLSTPLPIEDEKVDLVFLQSVFTHILDDGIKFYLREFERVLRPGGCVYTTVFIYNDDVLDKARKTNLTPYDLRFEHEISPGVRINNLEYPTGAVAFSEEKLREMISATNLKWNGNVLHGSWSGYYDKCYDGQDIVILNKV